MLPGWEEGSMQARRLFSWFSRSLPARLALFALLFLAAVVGVHVLALNRLVHVETVSGEVRNRWLDSISILYGVGRRLSDLRTAEADVVFVTDPARRQKQAAALPSLVDEVAKAIDRFKPLPHDPDENPIFNALLQDWAEHADHARRLASLVQTGQGDAAGALYDGAARLSFEAARNKNRQLVDISNAKAEHARDRTAQAFANAERWISELILGTGVLFAALAAYLWWSVSRPLFELAGLMRRLASHDTHFFVPVGGRRGRIG